MDELFRRLKIEDVPASWKAHEDAFDCWKSDGGCGELHWALPDDASLVFGLPDDILPSLTKAFTTIDADPCLTELAGLWHFLIYHLPEGTGDNPSTWPLLHEPLGELSPLFPLVVLVSGTQHSLDSFKNRGVSNEIATTTLSYAGYFVRNYHKKHGVWGLAELGWLTNFVHARLFQLGRLSFMAATYNWPFRAFRNRGSGEIMTLCEGNSRYRSDGLADGANNISDPDAWTPRLDIAADTIRGCRVSEDGNAVRKPVTLDTRHWEQVLAPGDRMIEVHIAADNGKLLPRDCRDSYRRALDVFPTLYQQEKFTAFTCWSWLLDPGLPKMLPPESNIASFQRTFHPLPVVGDHHQAYDLVFGDAGVDPLTAPKTTHLQYAIADYVASGNHMRSSAGFMTWDEVADLVKENR